MASSKSVTLRLSEDLLQAIQDVSNESRSMSDVVREALERQFRVGASSDENVRRTVVEAGEAVVTRGRYDFILPVGDVICWGTKPQVQLWWCPESEMKNVKRLCVEWEQNGFKLVVGQRGKGTITVPEEIESESQERKRGGRFSIGCRGQEARIGDKLMWLEVTDAVKALDWMKERTDIPVAVRADLILYSTDSVYRAVVERAEQCFVTYATTGVPLGRKQESEDDE